jgi:hypothetical protein
LLESLNVFELFGAGFAPAARTSQQRVRGCADRDESSGNNFRSRDKRLQAKPSQRISHCAAPQPPLVPIGSIFFRAKATPYPEALPLMIAQPARRDFLLPFRLRRDHLGLMSTAAA